MLQLWRHGTLDQARSSRKQKTNKFRDVLNGWKNFVRRGSKAASTPSSPQQDVPERKQLLEQKELG